MKRIGVVGEGRMGTSIFLYLNHFDYRLNWLCSSGSAAEEARKLFTKKLKSQLHCGVISEADFLQKTEQVVITDDPSKLAKCDLIIEAIPEVTGLKKALFTRLDPLIQPQCIFASNSSSILPSRLAPSDSRTDKTIGLHFFFPVQLKKYVEIIRHELISVSTLETINHFLEATGKKPLQQDETNAFMLNRLFLDLQAGAYAMALETGLSYREIDALVKAHLFPTGIFEFFDHVGLDVMLASIKNYSELSGNRQIYTPLITKLEELVSSNQLGIKTKCGFYDYRQPEMKPDLRETDQVAEYSAETFARLQELFRNSVRELLRAGGISPRELAEAVKDYTGADDPGFGI